MNKKYVVEKIEVPVYFFVEDNKVIINVESMEQYLDEKIQELVKQFEN